MDDLIQFEDYYKYKKNIKLDKNMELPLDATLELEPIDLCLITSEGFISNIQYIEQEFIKKVKLSDRIIKVQSNYGNVFVHPDYIDILYVVNSKVKRGRKPSDKKKADRKKQGNERGFHSQIEFFYYEKDQKIVRIKLFVNGRIQIPGVKREDFKDVEKVIKYFVRYINKFDSIKIDKNKKCEFVYITSVMENFKSTISLKSRDLEDKVLKLDFESLKVIFEAYKNYIKPKYEILVINQSFESPRFIIKFITPIKGKKKELFDEHKPKSIKKNKIKKTTLILFASGKMNINGGNNREESDYVIRYVYNIIKLHIEECYYINL